MRVVIVGATGNLGTSLIEALGASPEVSSVVGVARRRPTWSPPKTRWESADITADDLVPLFRGADVVVHLAWILQPSHDPATTWRVNVDGTVRVLDAVAEAGVPALVCASSVGAYSPGPADHEPVDETWPTHGWSPASYSREKAYVERLLDTMELRHPDRRVVRMRTAFSFKPESAAAQRRLFAGPLLPARLSRPDLVPVVPDIRGLRLQVLHSADTAEAYRLAILRDVHGPFNLAADPVVGPDQLAELLNARTVRCPPSVARLGIAGLWHLHLLPTAPHLFDAALRMPVMDCTRARTELGWSPRWDALTVLREFLDALRQGTEFATPPLARRAGRPLAGRYRKAPTTK